MFVSTSDGEPILVIKDPESSHCSNLTRVEDEVNGTLLYEKGVYVNMFRNEVVIFHHPKNRQ